jgi:NAD(P)-dependent dehydrogenase (short-subunit alcohol dehydrogenase family)
MEIKGKTAVVTGGASGLGEATVERLHNLGAKILVVDMNKEKGEALCQKLGGGIAFAHTNVTVSEQVQAAIELAMEKFKQIDICVNCAGTGLPMKIVGRDGPHDLNAFIQIIMINLVGTFDTARLAAFHMQNNEPNEDGERGVIINTASVAAYDGQIGQCAYSASKGGVVSMTLTIARDLARSGIRCCTIAPGLFDTPLMALMPEEQRIALGQQTPFPKRLGHAVEYAMMTQQIIENSYLNGETIRLDGAIRMSPK